MDPNLIKGIEATVGTVAAAPVANTFVTKVFNAVGILFAPTGIVRAARAEVEADKIRAVGRIEISVIEHRALERMVREQGKIQENIESITEKANHKLPPDITAETVAALDDEWIVNFFDKCRLVSNPEMQELWASILARQATQSGSFSKRTIEIVSTLERQDAESFAKLGGFVWDLRPPTSLVFDYNDSFYTSRGIDFVFLNHLASIGLLTIHGLGLQQTSAPDPYRIVYRGSAHYVSNAKTFGTIPIGKVMFTQAGIELVLVCELSPVEGFVEYVATKWAESGVALSCRWPPQMLDDDQPVKTLLLD